MNNIYLKAAKSKLRFKTNAGHITVEDLFDLPLVSKNGMDLDSVAKTVHNALKAEGETSFVENRVNPRKASLELAMEVVKDVIRIKQEEYAAKQDQAAKAAKKEMLKEALIKAQANALSSMTPEQIQAELEKLDKE